MRLMKTDLLRFLATIALLLMLGSASTCRADFQAALTVQQPSDLTVAISTLQTNLTRLEDPLQSLREAAVEASPSHIDLAAEEFDKFASSYYVDSFSFEEFAFQEMASFKLGSLEAENVKSLILSEKMLDVSVANVYIAIACYYEINETSGIVNAVEAGVEALQGFNLSLSMYSAGETLIEIPTPPSLALEDPDDWAWKVAVAAQGEMDRIVSRVADVDADMTIELIHDLIDSVIDWYLGRIKAPDIQDYWVQQALNFIHKTIKTLSDLVGGHEILRSLLHFCVDHIIKDALHDVSKEIIEGFYKTGDLENGVDIALNKFLEKYEGASPAEGVKDRLNGLFEEAYNSIMRTFSVFNDKVVKCRWIWGIITNIIDLAEWFIWDPIILFYLRVVALSADVGVIVYVTWEGYDYIDGGTFPFYNLKDGVVEKALESFDKAAKMLEGRMTLLTYCKFVSVNNGPWISVSPGQVVPASEGDPVKVYYRVSWPEEIFILLLGPLEVRIWELPTVVISPLNSTLSSAPTWQFNISYGETLDLEPKQVFTISSLPVSLSTMMQESFLNATFIDWPEFSWPSAIVVEESEITCALSKSTIPVGMVVGISGAVTPAHLTLVTIEYSGDGGTTWLPLASINSTADGSFSYLWAPTCVGTYLVRTTWAGDYDHEGAASPNSTLTVTKYPSMISCSVHPREAKRGKPITLLGQLYPAHAGVNVTLTYMRPDGSNTTRVVEAEHDGGFSDVYVPDVEGLWRVKASWLGDGDHEGCESPTQIFTVGFASPCQGQTYEIVICGAYHVEDDTVVVTPLYATDVVDDSVEGTLSFKVLEHPTGYTQVIAASTNISDVDRPLDALPIFIVLEQDDVVEINYKDCEYSEKVVQKEPLTQNYWIVYTGQTNSVTINAVEIPEFPSWLLFLPTFLVVSLFMVLLRHRTSRGGGSEDG